MPSVKEAAAEFLAKKADNGDRLVPEPKGHGSNIVYQRLGQLGYEVFAVDPNASEVEGDRCYHDLEIDPWRR